MGTSALRRPRSAVIRPGSARCPPDRAKLCVIGGSGNADLYVSAGNWPSRDSYQYRSAKAGNAESVTIANPPAGYVYVAVHAASAFSGVTVSARY